MPAGQEIHGADRTCPGVEIHLHLHLFSAQLERVQSFRTDSAWEGLNLGTPSSLRRLGAASVCGPHPTVIQFTTG